MEDDEGEENVYEDFYEDFQDLGLSDDGHGSEASSAHGGTWAYPGAAPNSEAYEEEASAGELWREQEKKWCFQQWGRRWHSQLGASWAVIFSAEVALDVDTAYLIHWEAWYDHVARWHGTWGKEALFWNVGTGLTRTGYTRLSVYGDASPTGNTDSSGVGDMEIWHWFAGPCLNAAWIWMRDFWAGTSPLTGMWNGPPFYRGRRHLTPAQEVIGAGDAMLCPWGTGCEDCELLRHGADLRDWFFPRQTGVRWVDHHFGGQVLPGLTPVLMDIEVQERHMEDGSVEVWEVILPPWNSVPPHNLPTRRLVREARVKQGKGRAQNSRKRARERARAASLRDAIAGPAGSGGEGGSRLCLTPLPPMIDTLCSVDDTADLWGPGGIFEFHTQCCQCSHVVCGGIVTSSVYGRPCSLDL
jgi:hypothetical protein